MCYWIFNYCCSTECLFHPTLPFIFSYTIFFRMFTFQWIRYSNVLIIFWLRNSLSIKYVRNWGNEGVHPKCVQVRTTGKGITPNVMCTYALISFKNGVFVRFFSKEINFCCQDISFFYFKLFCRTRVSQNDFNFNQIESLGILYIWVWSLPFLSKSLCSVARRFIWWIILNRYLQNLFYIVVFVVTVT